MIKEIENNWFTQKEYDSFKELTSKAVAGKSVKCMHAFLSELSPSNFSGLPKELKHALYKIKNHSEYGLSRFAIGVFTQIKGFQRSQLEKGSKNLANKMDVVRSHLKAIEMECKSDPIVDEFIFTINRDLLTNYFVSLEKQNVISPTVRTDLLYKAGAFQTFDANEESDKNTILNPAFSIGKYINYLDQAIAAIRTKYKSLANTPETLETRQIEISCVKIASKLKLQLTDLEISLVVDLFLEDSKTNERRINRATQYTKHNQDIGAFIPKNLKI